MHPQLPNRIKWPAYSIAMCWTGMTIVIYCMIVYGGFVELWGLNNTLTLHHYIDAFGIAWNENGILWQGSVWDSFWTTLKISAIAAPLTAMVGLVTAYLLVRQTFSGKNAFEFGTMLSFAIPGTVIGVSYILAFNVPPIELTGTGAILVLSFIFRNMPVGVRAGVASMSQLDKSLDEASLTLGANAWQTFRAIILPLMRPAILAAIVYSFVRAMTAISAVIFLVSAEYNMATSYIIGRVENNDYGLAITYSIREIQQKLGLTVVYVTHDQEEALAVSDRIIVMRNAEIAQSGTPRELFDAPQDAFVADFIGEANLIDCTVEAINGELAIVTVAGLNLELPARDLGVGKAVIAVRPGRVVLSAVDSVDTLLAQISKATYVGTHMEYQLATDLGELFAMSTQVD